MEAAKQEEVRRLALVAAEEALRAELECSVGASYACDLGDSGAGGETKMRRQRQCAVCCSPTTTRCSRCKSVRYCSGKCQIIHWRQGHKEECHPPSVDQCNGQIKVSYPDTVGGERCESSDSNFDIERELYVKPIEALFKRSTSTESNYSSDFFSEDDNLDDTSFANSSGIDSSSDSSSCSALSGPVEPPDDASPSEDFTRTSSGQFANVKSFGTPLDNVAESHDSSPDSPEPEGAFMKNVPPVFDYESISVNNASCSVTFEQNVSTCKKEVEASSGTNSNSDLSTECQVKCTDLSAVQAVYTGNIVDSKTCQEDECTKMDAIPTLHKSSKSFGHVRPFVSSYRDGSAFGRTARSEGAEQLGNRSTNDVGIEGSGPIYSGESDESDHAASLKYKDLRCVSSASPVDNLSSDGVYSAQSDGSSKIDNSSKVFIGLSRGIDSVPNGTCDMKKSVTTVVHHIKASEFSWRYSLGLTSYASEKYKMLFPYDLFVKLYNSDNAELRPFGLTNCGNSCYANAVIQCLAFTRLLTAYLMEGLHAKTCPKQEWCFTCELESLLMKAKQGTSPLAPIGIISQIKSIGTNLGHGREEDAHEFLRYSIDAMQSSCLEESGIKEFGINVVDPMVEETTFVQLVFGGYLQSKIRCMRCHGKSKQCERIMDLTVDINGDVGTLQEALTRFTATEILDGENKYLCTRCKSYERAKKKLTILEAPNVLTIALKRYQSGKFGKINKTVQFPECLNLAPYMRGTEDKSPIYRLYAVVVHLDFMNAAFSGHYICYVKNTQGKWYEIDDSVVKPVELHKVLTKDAYMLLYARCSPAAPSSVTKGMLQRIVKKGMYGEAVPYSHVGEGHKSRGRTNAMSSPSSSPSSYNQDTCKKFESCALFDKRLHNPRVNSSSDDSPLLSCSDDS